jgi:uracil phosphoribosyltransferase
MEIHNLGEKSSLFNTFMSEIRDEKIQKDPLRFRRNLERVGEITAYEISKTFSHDVKDVTTPLGVANVDCPNMKPVLATVLRAGLPFHNGFLNYFDSSENTFICAHRVVKEDGEFDIAFEYISSPDLTGKTVILVDPMLASGLSMEIGYKALFERGTPAKVHIAAVIASQQGIDYLQEKLGGKNITFWVGAIDSELNKKSYIIPGLGDAGDLAYGEKMDRD